MDKFDELLGKLKELSITQVSSDWAEDIPDEIWDEYFDGNFKIKLHNLNPERRNWNEISICVMKIYNRFLGIRYISNVFSQVDSISDYYFTLEFFEMEQIPTVTYMKI